MEVKYVNHLNKEIDLMKLPYLFQSGEFLNFTWQYEMNRTARNRVQNLQKADVSIPVTVAVVADTPQEFERYAYELIEATETDVLAGIPGRLYVNDYYMKCYVLQDIAEDWNKGIPYMRRTLYIMPDYPFWCREVTKSFYTRSPAPVKEKQDFLSYPFGYPYRYSMPRDAAFLNNDHYAPCDFQMVIYGPCENPAIRINGHLYEVTASLRQGEYLKADSRDRTVILYKIDGEQVNLFNQRNKDSSLFEKIPSGQCTVSWQTGDFGFDMTLFQERSEPRWIS